MKCEMCGSDSCNGTPVFMHGKCHMTAPTYVTLEEGIYGSGTAKKLSVYCAECDKLIVPFVVECVPGIRLEPRCHPEAEVWVTLHGEEDMRIQCSRCNQEFAKLKYLGAR